MSGGVSPLLTWLNVRMLTTQLQRLAAADDLPFIFSKLKTGSARYGRTLSTTSSGMFWPSNVSSCSLNAST